MARTDRERLLRGMISVVAAYGYENATVAEIAARADLPATAFDEHFESMEDCLLAAYDAIVEALFNRVSAAYEIGASWPERVRLGLEALLAEFSSDPETARVAAIEVPGAGARAQQRYREAIGQFVAFFKDGRAYAKSGAELPADIDLMAVGGAEAIIFDEVIAGRGDRLQSKLPEILFAVLVPYLGPHGAADEMRRAGRRD